MKSTRQKRQLESNETKSTEATTTETIKKKIKTSATILECEAWNKLAQEYAKEKKEEKAFQLYTLAAEQNHALSQYDLAECYFHGKGVAKDQDLAWKWLKKSAKNQFVDAEYQLGALYYNLKKYKNACKWFSKAANQFHVLAAFQMGYCYKYELGGKKRDLTNEYYYFSLAAEKGHADAQYHLALHILDYGDNETKAIALLTQASDQNHIEAKRKLAFLYYDGKLTTRNTDKASQLFLESMENHAESQYYYGLCCLKTHDTFKDTYSDFASKFKNSSTVELDKIFDSVYYRGNFFAADSSSSSSSSFCLRDDLNQEKQTEIEKHLECERLQKKNETEKGIKWIESAANLNHIDACFFMGNCFGLGKYGKKMDLNKADEYWKKAVEIETNNIKSMNEWMSEQLTFYSKLEPVNLEHLAKQIQYRIFELLTHAVRFHRNHHLILHDLYQERLSRFKTLFGDDLLDVKLQAETKGLSFIVKQELDPFLLGDLILIVDGYCFDPII
jgi:TPR repeat protein